MRGGGGRHLRVWEDTSGLQIQLCLIFTFQLKEIQVVYSNTVVFYIYFQFKKTRLVTQYHYTAWPDHGTPDPMNLLEFHHHVITCSTHSESSPTVVHCR